MNHVIVFGAGGRVGRRVVKRLLADGYEVTAFTHSRSRFAKTDRLHVVRGDVRDPAAVAKAMKGADVVVSALGSWGTPTKDILSVGMASIIPAMNKHQIRRIVSLTGSEARAHGDKLGAVHRLAHAGASLFVSKILIDGERHISQLEESGLDWTVIRSPVMTDRGVSGYRLNSDRPQPWTTINRQAVADAMVDQLSEMRFVGTAPFIHR